MTNKFEVIYSEFKLSPRDTKGFKKFVAEIPDTAAYKIENRPEGIFFNAYWINVNNDPEPVMIYTIDMPMSCIFGKQAFELVNGLNPQDGIPFLIRATDTIDLSKGFIDILVRKIKNCQAPYIIAEGWIKEHMLLLEDALNKHHVVIRELESVISR